VVGTIVAFNEKIVSKATNDIFKLRRIPQF